MDRMNVTTTTTTPLKRRNGQSPKMNICGGNKPQKPSVSSSSCVATCLYNKWKIHGHDNSYNDTDDDDVLLSSFPKKRRRPRRRKGIHPTSQTHHRTQMPFMSSFSTFLLIWIVLQTSTHKSQTKAMAFSFHSNMISRVYDDDYEKILNCGCSFPHRRTNSHTITTHLSFRLSSFSLSAAAAAKRSQIHTKHDKKSMKQEDPNTVLPPFQMEVLYESDRVLAIHKPSGIPHHDDPEQHEKGILTLCRDYQQQQQQDASIYQGRLYGVHRLDRVTSGILLFAKDAEMASYLSQKFRHVKSKTTTTSTPKTGTTTTTTGVTKYYFGISMKKPKKKKQGWVRGTMVRGRRKSWYLTTPSSTLTSSNDGTSKKTKPQKNAARNKRNKESRPSESIEGGKGEDKQSRRASKAGSMGGNGGFAETRFFTAGIGHLASYYCRGGNKIGNPQDVSSTPKTCLLFRPYTGKTHQLRVAAKSIGLPLMGDPIYSDGSSSPTVSCHNDDDNNDDSDNYDNEYQRTYLHASAIHIHADHPGEESFTIWSPPPFDETLWPASTVDSSTKGKDGFRQTVIELLRKNCDCHEILQLAEAWYTAD